MEIRHRFGTMVFDAVLETGAEEIESQAVLFGFVLIEQSEAKSCPLFGVHDALEDGVLHPLTEIEAGLGNTAKPARPGGIFRRDIVADDDEHGGTSSPEEGWVLIQIASEEAGEKEGLQMREHPHRDFFVEKRMPELFLLSFLVGDEDNSAGLVAHGHATRLVLDESTGIDLSAVDKREDEAVCDERSEFLNQVQC